MFTEPAFCFMALSVSALSLGGGSNLFTLMLRRNCGRAYGGMSGCCAGASLGMFTEPSFCFMGRSVAGAIGLCGFGTFSFCGLTSITTTLFRACKSAVCAETFAMMVKPSVTAGCSTLIEATSPEAIWLITQGRLRQAPLAGAVRI
jgi:hypothetical protein